ncbi:hypothetical protein [Nodosilinea sp. E11]|uniref:hypothetical protein n=1 Tax=Nodosilinea sp. E11 TaxID=3037479 RepID=UPI0029351ED0|nr:hypothetical protein [Nodosilinea sp. E11]WOD41677.1 hypothetical protein RRF56_12835 [Nodosilinea sp. E11]
MPSITLADIRAIAQYRGWSLQQTIDWLEIKPAHQEALLAEDPHSNQIAGSQFKVMS